MNPDILKIYLEHYLNNGTPIGGCENRLLDFRKMLQQELKDLGYYRGNIDGRWGDLSRKAVQDFLTVHGMGLYEVNPGELDEKIKKQIMGMDVQYPKKITENNNNHHEKKVSKCVSYADGISTAHVLGNVEGENASFFKISPDSDIGKFESGFIELISNKFRTLSSDSDVVVVNGKNGEKNYSFGFNSKINVTEKILNGIFKEWKSDIADCSEIKRAFLGSGNVDIQYAGEESVLESKKNLCHNIKPNSEIKIS